MVSGAPKTRPTGSSTPNKRQTSPKPPKRRIKPAYSGYTAFRVTNLDDNETVHQKCLILSGDCPSFDNSADDYIAITSTDAFSQTTGPQHWPTSGGNKWRAVAMLSSGVNKLSIKLWHAGGISGQSTLSVNYVSLTQVPPLHLAIMVAKDSPLLVPCPPSKFGAISSAHSGLDAVIKKFRMTAYMWQAALAEEMRARSRMRRTFRLEEEFAVDSTKQVNRHGPSAKSTMGSIAKVHIVRSERTVAEIQNGGRPNVGAPWQRHYGGMDINRGIGPREMFAEALRAYGGPLASQYQPMIAGLVLDGQCVPSSGTDGSIVGQGGHQDVRAPPLAMCGSQEVYAWPRFLEEVSSCILDPTLSGDLNPRNESQSIGGTCCSSQAGFFEAVLSALGSGDGQGRVPYDISSHWKRLFVSPTLGESEYESPRSLQQTLRLRLPPQLRMPSDDIRLCEPAFRQAEIKAFIDEEPDMYQDEGVEAHQILRVICDAGLADVTVQDAHEHELVRFDYTRWTGWEAPPSKECRIDLTTLPRDPGYGLARTAWVVAGNGKAKNVDIAGLLKQHDHQAPITIPGTSIRLNKTSVRGSHLSYAPSEDRGGDDDDEDSHIPWHILLTHPDPVTGAISGVDSIDLRVGACFDGIIVEYQDGHRADNRPWINNDHFGGHQSQKQHFPDGSVDIAKVELPASLDGIRITLTSGVQFGALNEGHEEEVAVLAPKAGEKIVGFFGFSSDKDCGFVEEFGVLTISAGEALPEAVYGVIDGLNGRSATTADGCASESEGETQVRTISVHDIPPQRRTNTILGIPGSSLHLRKISVRSESLDEPIPEWRSEGGYKPWAFLFNHQDTATGHVSGLSYISLRVGSTFDGIIVGYEDGARADNRPWINNGRFAGGRSRTETDLHGEVEVVKVELNLVSGMYGFDGCRLTLADGTVFGTLNEENLDPEEEKDAIVVLEPEEGQRVVGFFGTSDGHDGYVFEFGILTLPANEEVPEEAYGMQEFQRNGQGGRGHTWDDEVEAGRDESQETVS